MVFTKANIEAEKEVPVSGVKLREINFRQRI